MRRIATIIGLAAVLGFILSAGAHATPGICAFKFYDVNGNGEFDEGEDEWLPGVEICYVGPEGGDCKVTDEQGAACWLVLPLGDYEVCVNLDTIPEDWEMTTDACQVVTLVPGEILQLFFGCWPGPVPTERTTWGTIKAMYH